jgi:hypothetical protein
MKLIFCGAPISEAISAEADTLWTLSIRCF